MHHLIKLPEVLERTSLSRSALYRLLSEGRFPTPAKVTGARINAWSADEINAWIEAQLTAREPA